MRPASVSSERSSTGTHFGWFGGGGVGGVAGELAEKSAARKMHQSPKHLVSVTDDF